MDFADYGDSRAYNQDYRFILQAKHDFNDLIGLVYARDEITADDLAKAFEGAFSGRLSLIEEISETGQDIVRLDYCAGQYMPTEYRSAACAVLASAIWHNYRTEKDYLSSEPVYPDGPAIRQAARLRFGRGIQNRWFN